MLCTSSKFFASYKIKRFQLNESSYLISDPLLAQGTVTRRGNTRLFKNLRWQKWLQANR
jgi:hypothetical protein